MRVEPDPMGLVPLYEEEETQGVPESSYRGKTVWGHLDKVAILKPTRDETGPHLDLGFPSLQNCEK